MTLLSVPSCILPNILSYLTLKDVLHMRCVCTNYSRVIFELTHHLWMDGEDTIEVSNNNEEDVSGNDESLESSSSGDSSGSSISMDDESSDDDESDSSLEESDNEDIDDEDLNNNMRATNRRRDIGNQITTSRQIRHLLERFPNICSLRLTGVQLTYRYLVGGRNGAALSPRYLCTLLKEECSGNLECLELLNVCEAQNENVGGGSAVSMHTDIQLNQLRKLKITLGSIAYENEHRDYPLVFSLLRSSNQITHLNLSGCISLNDYHLEVAIMRPLINTLTHLNLSNSGIQMPTINSDILQSLTLQQCLELRGINPGSYCPMLQTLDLSRCPQFLGEGLMDESSALFQFSPRLQTLSLRDCTALKFVKIEQSITGDDGPSCGLAMIDLTRCVHLSSAYISCPQMKKIHLRKCLNISALTLSSTQLKTLDLSSLPLELVSLDCPSLKHLDLSGCCNLDSKRSIIKSNALESVDIRRAIYMTPDFFTGIGRKDLKIHTQSEMTKEDANVCYNVNNLTISR